MRNKFQFGSVFIKTFLMLSVSSTVLLVVFNVSFISFYNKTFEERLFASNLNMVTKTRSYLDLILGDVVKEANLLAQDSSIVHLAVVPSINLSAMNHTIISRLRSVVAENPYVKSVYLFIPTGDFVFSSSGAITALADFADKSAIVADPRKGPPSGSIMVRGAASAASGADALTLHRDFPKNGVWRLGQVIINLNTDALNAAIRNHADVGSDELVVVDAANRVVLGNYPLGTMYGEDARQGDAREGYRLLQDGDRRQVLFYSASAIADWRCVYRIEQGRGSLFAQLAFTVFLPASFIFLLISFVFAAVLSNSLYGPIDSLLALVRVGTGSEGARAGEPAGDEYAVIRAGVSGIVARKASLEDLVERSVPFVKIDFFSMLLHNDELDPRDLAFFEQYLDVGSYRGDQYAVFIAGVATPVGERPLDLVEQRFALLQMKEEIEASDAGFEHVVCASSQPGEIAIVCCFARGLGEDDIRLLLTAFIDGIRAGNAGVATGKITLSAGKASGGIVSIARSYAEAREAIRYSRYIGSEAADDELALGRGQRTLIRDIVAAIGAGEASAIADKVATLFADSPGEARPSARQTALELIDAIAQFLITANYRGNNIMTRQRDALRRIEESAENAAIAAVAAEFCAAAVHAVARVKATRHSKYVIKAQEYVEENYADCELSLNSAANHVGLTGSYLSTLFRNEMHETFIDFVNRLRIGKARELLDNTLISVKEAGYAVGFNTIHNFIRTFKKFEGTTPGKYKESSHASSERRAAI